MKDVLRLGAVFIGLMVGGGFASGQEVIQFFSAFGRPGLLGCLVSGALFAVLVLELYAIGCQLQIHTHQQAMTRLFGRRAAPALDLVLCVCLFCMITVMVAGGGASIQQQFGLPAAAGSAIMAALAWLAMVCNARRIVDLVGIMTPLVMLMVTAMLAFALAHPAPPAAPPLPPPPRAAANWLASAVLYVSFNVAGAAPVLLVVGGQVAHLRTARLGGLAGGAVFGALLLGLAFVLHSQDALVHGSAVPTLRLAGRMSPLFGAALLPVILLKLYCSAVGMTYTLAVRLQSFGLPRMAAAAGIALGAWGMSQLGFVALVNRVYPAIGYFGLVLMAVILASLARRPLAQPRAASA